MQWQGCQSAECPHTSLLRLFCQANIGHGVPWLVKSPKFACQPKGMPAFFNKKVSDTSRMRNISHIFCNFAPTLERKVSSSLKNRQIYKTQKIQYATHIMHICGLPFCVWVQVFGDTFELMQTVAHFL